MEIDIAKRRGHFRSSKYDHAIDKLHKVGYITELWVELKTDAITLKWIKNGSRWHTTVRGPDKMPMLLDQLGRSATLWLDARATGTADESNYAVREV